MSFLSLYSSRYIVALVYMLQSTEYNAGTYLRWWWRTNNFNTVMHRRELEKTRPAKLLLLALSLGMLTQVLTGLSLIWLEITRDVVGAREFGLVLILSYPIVWAHVVVIPLWLGRVLIIGPKQRKLIAESRPIFASHKGTKIAVAGSYGKTSMKELLVAVLSEGKHVAATPGNKNVSVSHAYFARRLDGNEDVVVVEFGEGKPGDVTKFTSIVQPTVGIITGLAPAHLDAYDSVEEAGKDIFSLTRKLPAEKVYVNGDSPETAPFTRPGFCVYDVNGVQGWKVSGITISIEGTQFTLKKDKTTLRLHSKLLGRHNIGPLALAAALAHDLGLSKTQIESGIAKTKPYEHRMQPRQLHGAWIIDDTYNGTIEGMKAGLELLAELPARRKLYVTPGLVDQGEETEKVHTALGEAIAVANPDIVILMKNSVTEHIRSGMQKGKYKGEVRTEDDPLDFYTNLEHIIAAGDLVLMQNDWTDNYN